MTRAEPVRIWLLGGFRVSVGSRTVEEDAWRLRKAAALVKLLALAPGHRLHREQAMDLLWSNSGRRAASNNLRKNLHAARKVFDSAAGSRYLASEDESLVLCPESDLWVDVEAFDEAARTARRSRDAAAYRAALELYAGDLLPADRYQEWADSRREELRRTFLSLSVELAGIHQQRGEYGLGIEALRKVVAEEPTNQEAHVGLMRLYALSERQAEALAQYERLEETLSRELRAEPNASSRVLREEIVAGRFPPSHRPVGPLDGEISDPLPHNLPAPRTSFVGREREMVEIKRTLAMTRLLTLTGAGGSGKTRLALEVARELVGAYSDGVWLVELAPLSESGLVSQAVAGALGVREQSGRSLADVLVDTLRSKEMLLVLDNCEHLIDTVASLVDVLLNSCSRLRILATSRELLGVAGEVRWPVPALSVPDPRRSPTVAELEGSEAARLFAERARQRNSTFALTSENARTVTEICRKLEGMPLAIELAAARVGALSVEQISKRLEDSLKLLTGGSRTEAPRQRTLKGTLDWSHKLLGEPERKLFRRLSVFAGGWTLEAVEAVVSGGGVEEADVLDLLSGLVDKSLVVAETTGDGGVRYRLLEPVRQYALEKLEESGEADAVRHRHARFFLALAEEAEPALKGQQGAQQGAWLERIEAEHDNLRAALQWLPERGDAKLGLRLAGALGEFWFLRGYFGEGRRWLEEALARGIRSSTASRAIALEEAGWLAYLQGDLDRAEEASEEGLKLEGVELFREAGDWGSVAAYLRIVLGATLVDRGNFERATAMFEESLALSREAGDSRGVAFSLGSLGNASRDWGDHERAIERYEEALALGRELDDPTLLAAILTSLGHELVLQGDHERATAVSEEAAAISREQGYTALSQDAPKNLGWAALLRGDHERAKVLFEESLALCQELGDKLMASKTLDGLACTAQTLGEAKRAARLFGAAEALREAEGYGESPAEHALREPYLAAVRSQLGDAAWAAAREEGKAMTAEQAVEYALSEEEIAAPVAPATPEEPPARVQPAALTRREEEVAALVAQGLTNRQVASELSISEHTVATHVAKIMKKLGLRSRAQITAWVIEQRTPSSGLG